MQILEQIAQKAGLHQAGVRDVLQAKDSEQPLHLLRLALVVQRLVGRTAHAVEQQTWAAQGAAAKGGSFVRPPFQTV